MVRCAPFADHRAGPWAPCTGASAGRHPRSHRRGGGLVALLGAVDGGASRLRTDRRARRCCARRPASRPTRWASCRGLSLGRSPRSRPLAFATRHPFLGPQPDEVGLPRDHGQHVEQQPGRPRRSGRRPSRPAETDLPGGELVGDRPASGSDRARRSAWSPPGCRLPARSEGLAQSGPFAVGAGQAVVDVDPGRLDTQVRSGRRVGGEVLLVGGAPCVADEKRRHGAPPVCGPARHDAATPTASEAAISTTLRSHGFARRWFKRTVSDRAQLHDPVGVVAGEAEELLQQGVVFRRRSSG